MQVSRISSFNFMGASASKKAVSTLVKNTEKNEVNSNPMKKFIEETPNFRDFYSPRNVITEEKPVDYTKDFYPPRNIIVDSKIDSAEQYQKEIDKLVAQKRSEIK